MLPMRCENRIRPAVQIRMLNNVSALLVLAIIFCPYALHVEPRYALIQTANIKFQQAISNQQGRNKNSKIVRNRFVK